MRTIAMGLMTSAAVISACASSPAGAIEVRGASQSPVSGTAFTCTDHPETVLTPCDEFSTLQTGTRVRSLGPDTIALYLSRSSNEVDRGSVTAVITLQLGGRGAVSATALESTEFETGSSEQPALDGWIEPVAVSPTPEGRNAGRFSLTFDWGTMSGTYDTANE